MILKRCRMFARILVNFGKVMLPYNLISVELTWDCLFFYCDKVFCSYLFMYVRMIVEIGMFIVFCFGGICRGRLQRTKYFGYEFIFQPCLVHCIKIWLSDVDSNILQQNVEVWARKGQPKWIKWLQVHGKYREELLKSMAKMLLRFHVYARGIMLRCNDWLTWSPAG